MANIRFTLGRIIFGLILICYSGLLKNESHILINRHLHEARKEFISPKSKASDPSPVAGLTNEEFNSYIIKANFGMLAVAGVLVICNFRKIAGPLIIIAMLLHLATKDNLMLPSNK